MSANNLPATANSGALQTDAIDPSRAAAGYQRWRRAVADALGEDPGARLDRPDRRLTMLRIFGSTRRLAELCLKHPTTAMDAMVEGASSVLASTARDIAALSGGVGGPDAIYAAFAPLKNRADIAIAVAELSGVWTAAEATAARTDFAERLVETALSWLVRNAVNRGELSPPSDDRATPHVFALAGRDFAHEDLAPIGPLDLAVIYDDQRYGGPNARQVERAFVRISSELKEAIEGKSGDYPLYQTRTPFGTGVGGVGFVESQSRAAARTSDPQQPQLRAWLATSRVVAGDRRAGGAFLEKIEEIVWDAKAARPGAAIDDDPRTGFRAVADVFRFAFGASRPVFRTASTRAVIETAGVAGDFPRDIALRLAAGEEFVQGVHARLQLMKGAGATYASLQPDEEAAIARLCGFASPDALKATLSGAVSDAVNTLALIAGGPLAEFEMYKSAAVQPDDVDKLEDLGFRDGVSLSGIAETWAGLAGASGARFASVAPGLLTQIGETQRPDRAVKLLDALVRQSGDPRMVFAALGADGPIRDGLVDALGCFGDAAEPLTETAALAAEFFEERGDETPASGGEWISRYAPPKTPSLEAVASWRRQNIARVSLCAATGAMSFGAAADALAAIGETALKEVFGAIRRARNGADNISLHVFQSSVFGLPGSPTAFGFITKDGAAADGEQFARDFVAAVESLGAGYFEMTADLSRRPKGAAGPLAPNGGAFRAYMQSEAVATDQTALARVRVIAGSEAAQDHAKKSLRSQSGGPKRADLVLRDLDRARAQRLRRDKGGSEWDIPQAEGGLADIDLIIGALIVRHGASLPALQSASADEALDALARANAIAEPAAETLKSARAFWLRLAAARALARWTDPEREPVRGRFASLLARAAEVDRLALVRPLMRGYAEEVSRLYAQLVLGRPASHLAA